MSKRLQVVLDDAEFDELQRIARSEGTTLSDWVRRALRTARRTGPERDVDAKLAALRAATGHAFPTADIDDMLDEIERGYPK